MLYRHVYPIFRLSYEFCGSPSPYSFGVGLSEAVLTDTDSLTAVSVWEVYEHAIWSSGQTHAEAALIQFILPSSMPALMGWLCLCVHMSVYDVQFMGDRIDSFHSDFSLYE